jgi:hypothetical protein
MTKPRPDLGDYALRPYGLSPVSRSQAKPAAAIAGPSRSFIELTRNIELAEQAPRRFEPTVKQPGDVVL